MKENTDFLILDMRGNGGGDDSYGLELARHLNCGPIRFPTKYTKVSLTPASIAIFANICRYWKAIILAQSLPVPDYLEEIISEQDRRLEQA